MFLQIKLTEDHMWLGNYGCLFQRLCSTTGEVPVGMLRTEEAHKETMMGSGKSAETKDIERIIRNRMKSLNIEGECTKRSLHYVVLACVLDFIMRKVLCFAK